MFFREFISNRNEKKKKKVKLNKSIYLGLSILEISKTLMYEVWYGYIELKYQYNQKYTTWIQLVLPFILKLKMFKRALQMMLEKDLIHGIMKSINLVYREK